MAELDAVFAKQFGTNVLMKAQQEYSVLLPFVQRETVNGEKKSIPLVNPTVAHDIVDKYGDTVWTHTEFDNRWLRPHGFEWADALDWSMEQGVGPIIDPKAPIVRSGASAVGRKIDDIIIQDAFYGASYNGRDGLDQQAFPDAQKVAITTGGTGGANTGLNMEKLRQIHEMLGMADVDINRPGNELFIAVTQKQISDLVKDIDQRNKDYDTVNALYNQQTDKFLGFRFIRINRLARTALDSGYSRLCVAWVKSGIVYGENKAMSTVINTRPDKRNIWQVYMSGSAGATRTEDCKVIQVPCLEA